MSLLLKIVDQVGLEVRQRGVKSRAKGQVRIDVADDQYIDATVKDAKNYIVNLTREPDAVLYACECKNYLNELEVCEHVWATLMEADAKGYLESWDGPGPVSLDPVDDETIEMSPDAGRNDEVDDDGEFNFEAPSANLLLAQRSSGKTAKGDDWKQGFEALRQTHTARDPIGNSWPAGKQLLYVIDLENTMRNGLTIELMSQERRKDGAWGKPKHESLGVDDAARLPDRNDAEVIAMLAGSQRDAYGYYYSSHERSSRYKLADVQYVMVLRRACETGRCRVREVARTDFLQPIEWDDSAWEFWLTAHRDPLGKRFILTGELRSGEKRMALSEPLALLQGGIFITKTHAARYDHNQAFGWIALLRRQGKISAPLEEGDELLKQLLTLPELPKLELPEELKFERVTMTPKPRLRVRKPPQRSNYFTKPKLTGELSFDYEGQVVMLTDPTLGIYQAEKRRMIARDMEFERASADRLRMLGFRNPRNSYYYDDDLPQMELAPTQLPAVIRALLSENWFVEADGALYRQPGEFKMEVSSGIDWFELHGNVDFNGQNVGLPELLKALRRGERMIRLDDGTFGVLPEQWLQKFGLLAGMGDEKKDHVRFKKTQVGLLDALLMSQPDVRFDANFQLAREELQKFSGVSSAEAPPTFVGTLRPYQREGLGWLEFLRKFGFGGCLADDMGLGKTVQVLALLEERRLMRVGDPAAGSNGSPKERPGPSLVVAPRSLVFNWREEALRFAPQLRVLDHTGIGRAKTGAGFEQYDLILTTYGTLRNDITFFKDVPFDYVVLDEAQAVKNASSESAKAARLLGGSHRLALSGTPVQNHLGELWSLFEFLNPGMLGAAKAFAASGAGAKVVDEASRTFLSRALRPFILRRTKAQVAQDLPQRLEQTIHCELDAAQRKQYNDLKEHYRQSLLSKIAVEGIAKNKIQVLEALLRLRQAACHPGLIDKSRVDESSAKLDALLPQLAEVTDGGHKALVFSQFTSMLAIVRARLDKDNVKYAYLDGRTRDRQEVVNQFQTDEDCKLFLISLKAGGVGLNLTAAEYVFLLDPWWNPAVEAQAIDRAHRIGQTRQVFAYRLIAKDTVEEKVLQLQNSKRELADAIINADNSVIGKLGREDLELLLS